MMRRCMLISYNEFTLACLGSLTYTASSPLADRNVAKSQVWLFELQIKPHILNDTTRDPL